MAFGSGTQYDPNTKTFSFNLKDKDLPAPLFEVQTKEGDKYVAANPATATRVSGNLTGVRVKENTYQGKVIKSVTATIEDPANSERYFVSIPFTYLGRNIMNSLCGLATFSAIELSVYKGKPKTEGKPGFSSSALRQAGELVYGKYEYKDLPAIPKGKVGQQTISDPTEIDAFFVNQVNELAKRIKSAVPAPAAGEVSVVADQGKGDEPPF